MKFLKKEDPQKRRKKTLRSKRKRDSQLCQSQKKVKDIKDSKKIITDRRLTVPHMQPGIFLKGKSTVSYQRVKGAKLNALNQARMNENLVKILNFANDPVKSYGDGSGGKSKFHPHLGNINGEETLSLQISQDASKNEYGQNPYKNKLEIFLSSEDSSDEEKNESNEHSEFFFQNTSNKNIEESEEEFDGESKYIEFKRFLTYFDTHVYLEDSLTDLITIEMTGIMRKLRKGNNSRNSPRNEDIKNASLPNNRIISEQNENSVNCVKFSKNIKNTKIKMPKKDTNYNMFQNRKPEKITIVKQMQGKDMTEVTQNSPSKNMSRKFPCTQNKFNNFETNLYKIDYLPNQYEASPKKHSVQNMIHSDSSLSMLDPLHFLEVTMSQPEIAQTFSVSSETSTGETINFERDMMASAFSAPPDLCEETLVPQFQDHSFDYFKSESETNERKEEFYDWFNPCKINDPSPSNLNSFFSNESKFISRKTEETCRKKCSKDLFHLSDRKEKSYFPSSSRNVVFSPEVTNGFTKERSSPYFHDIQGLTKLHIQLKEEASPKEFYNNEKPDRYKISRDSYVLSSYHPKIVVSPPSEFEETEIQLNNLWQRRKMF